MVLRIKKVLKKNTKFSYDHFVALPEGYSIPLKNFWDTKYDLIIFDNHPIDENADEWNSYLRVFAKKILSQKALKEYVGTEIRPGKNIFNQNELDEVIKNTSESAYHPSCTNKMGEDKTSVVDQNLRVHGIQNLRVIDASVMPDIVSANLNATTIMIAEKAYDQINNTVS